MTGSVEAQLVAIALAFCRFGACLMLIPGVGTARLPVRVRLSIALVLAAALGPSGGPDHASALDLARAVVNEVVTGAVIGGAARVAIFAMSFAASLVAAHVGLLLAAPSTIDDNEPSPHLADLLLVMAVTTVFLSDLHLHLIRTLHHSYAMTPAGASAFVDLDFGVVAARLVGASHLGLQLAAPLVALSVLVNLVLGVLNRALPMVPMQFVGAPALLLLGTLLVGDIAPLIGQRFLEALHMSSALP